MPVEKRDRALNVSNLIASQTFESTRQTDTSTDTEKTGGKRLSGRRVVRLDSQRPGGRLELPAEDTALGGRRRMASTGVVAC